MKMKTWNGSILVALIMMLGACTNGDDNSPNGGDPNVITEAGKWRVSFYFDKDKVETNNFSAYTFDFLDNGLLRGEQNGNLVEEGTWLVNSSSNKLVITFSTTGPFDDLSDDWVIQEMIDELIRLRDDNDEHLEELHFSAIP